MLNYPHFFFVLLLFKLILQIIGKAIYKSVRYNLLYLSGNLRFYYIQIQNFIMDQTIHQKQFDLSQNDHFVESPLQAHSIMGANPVSVCCRLKPILMNQEKANIHLDMKEHAIVISQDSKQITKTFAFDQIFDENVCQHKFTKTICDPLIQFLKHGGEGGLIFSYGVTNSGKTHSILGNIDNPGVLYYLIKKLEEQFGNGSVKITAFQLYNDEFFSLKNKEKMIPKQFCGFLEFDNYEPDTILAENMESILNQYMSNRSQGDTKFNPKSSRSHAIFKIQCNQFKIGVVDLAGSQRSKAGVGQKITETISINKSLLLLGRCIQALKDKKKNPNIRIPFRQSKLTQVLMEYFTNGFKIRIIANINQARAFYFQNIQVLEYTSIAKNITNNCSSQFAQAVKSARKKYELIKSNFKSQKQKSNMKSQYKAKVKINQTSMVINQDTFQNEQRDTQFRRWLILSQKNKVQLEQDKKSKQMHKECQLIQDINVSQQAFSIFLDYQHKKQAEEDRKFLSNLKKVNFDYVSQKKDDKFTQTGVNTIQDYIECLFQFQKLNTEVKKNLGKRFQSERKRQMHYEDANFQTQFSQRKMHQTPKKGQIKTQQNQEILDLIFNQQDQRQIREASNQSTLSEEDNDFIKKSFRSIKKALVLPFQSGRKFINDCLSSFKQVGTIVNQHKSHIKERRTHAKARKFRYYQTEDITIGNNESNQNKENQNQNQEESVKQVEFKEPDEEATQQQMAMKILCDQYVSATVQTKCMETQTDFIQKNNVKFMQPSHSKKKNTSYKKQYEKSVERKNILKNKNPLKYCPPTPVAKRTRHVRRKA